MFCPMEKRQRILNGTMRFARILPSNHNMVCSEGVDGVWNDKRGTTSLQDYFTWIDADVRGTRVLGLPDHDKIRATGLACQHMDRKIERLSPLHVSSISRGSIAKPFLSRGKLGFEFSYVCFAAGENHAVCDDRRGKRERRETYQGCAESVCKISR
jgi:hypothetical protein